MRALWSDRPNCSHKVSQKVKRIRRLSHHCKLQQQQGPAALIWSKHPREQAEGRGALNQTPGAFFTVLFEILAGPLCRRKKLSQESPQQTKPKKGPKRKVHEFRPFLWTLVFFLRKTSTIHIELLFRNAPGKSSWTDLSLVWFAGATPDCRGFLLYKF